MPRMGITPERILGAIEALRDRGEKIDKITVRKELGDTGSFGTITTFLQSWRLKQSTPEQEVVTVPIPEAVQGLFLKAWSIAQATAHAELTPQREALDREAAGLKTVLTQAQAENDEAIRVLEWQMDHLEKQLAVSQASDTTSQARVAELAETVGYLRAKLEATTAEAHQVIAAKDAVIASLEGRLETHTEIHEQ